MALYHYKSTDGINYHYNESLKELPKGFLHYEEKSFGEVSLFYQTTEGKMTDIIAYSIGSEENARKEMKETFSWIKRDKITVLKDTFFLANTNLNP